MLVMMTFLMNVVKLLGFVGVCAIVVSGQSERFKIGGIFNTNEASVFLRVCTRGVLLAKLTLLLY